MSVGAIAGMFAGVAPAGAGAPAEKTSAPSVADQVKQRADAAKLRQKQTLEEIREKGIYTWAQEQKAEKIKETIREELEARAASEDKTVPGSDPSTWSKDDFNLEAEVVRRMREILENALKAESEAAVAEGKPPKPMVIDISV